MISLKSEKEMEKIREASRIAALVMDKIAGYVEPGITTKRIEDIAVNLINENNAKPAFKGYNGFPGSICASINEEVIHGIPNNRVLQEGDIVSIDLGIKVGNSRDGEYFADTASTFKVGEISVEVKKLLEVAERSLYLAVEECKSGNRIGDISYIIQSYVEENGFSVVRDFVGHGIGRKIHEEPQIPNFGKRGHGPRIKEGMVFCIEPMVNMGVYNVKILEDKWTVVTEDGKRSAHFEHTIAITEKGAEILTGSITNYNGMNLN